MNRPRPHKGCGREGCNGTRRGPNRFCTPICYRMAEEMDRAIEVLPQAQALGIDNTTEQWTLLVEAADVWTRYLDARREMGRRIQGPPPWSRATKGRSEKS